MCHATELGMRSIRNIRSLRKMAEKSASSSKGGKKSEQMSQEKIIGTFQQLRMEQRAIATKIGDVEADKNEHK